MAYDPVVRVIAVSDSGQLMSTTTAEMNSITGSGCFAGGPVTFTAMANDGIHIQYLLRQCQARFFFDSTVCYILLQTAFVNYLFVCNRLLILWHSLILLSLFISALLSSME